MSDPWIDAKLREREGYEKRGLKDKVAHVDEQLELAGYSPPAPPTPPKREQAQPETASLEATETATVPKGRPRRSEPNA